MRTARHTVGRTLPHLAAAGVLLSLILITGRLAAPGRAQPPAASPPDRVRETVTGAIASAIDNARATLELSPRAALTRPRERTVTDSASVAGITVLPPGTGSVAADTSSPVSLAPAESALFALTNADRTAGGLAPVRLDTQVLAIARERAAEQLPLVQISHFDADGNLVFEQLLLQSGVTYRLAGENLARVTGPEASAAELAEQGLMGSQSHRDVILEPSFDYLAVGAAVDSVGRVVFVQIFRAVGGP